MPRARNHWQPGDRGRLRVPAPIYRRVRLCPVGTLVIVREVSKGYIRCALCGHGWNPVGLTGWMPANSIESWSDLKELVARIG